METKYYRLGAAFIGGFAGSPPPAGAVEISAPPVDGRYLWNGTEWTVPAELKDVVVQEKRIREYVKRGVTLTAVIEAIVEKLFENRPEKMDALQAIRLEIKEEFPKSEDVKP